MERKFKNPENPVIERFSGGGNLLSSNSKGFGGAQHSQANRICHAEFISASSHLQVVTTSETQNDHSREHTSGQSLKQVQDCIRKVGCAHLRTVKKLVAFTLAEGATHVVNFVDGRKVAFTLAEVLITLGIIGVVAAMTLPALLVKTKTSEYSARLKKFYSTMNQAIKMSELDNGPCEYWDYEKLTYLSNGADSPQEEKDSVAKESSDKASAFLDKYIRPYMKGERSDDFNWVTETKGVEIKAPGIKFHDGSAVYVKTGDCFDFAFDANGSAPPNERGKDQFIFMYCNKEHNAVKGQCFTPYWTKYTKNKPRQYWIEQCANQPYYCSALLFIDGWEFKKDYPFKVK